MYICSFPQDQEIDEEFELLVLASDGLWDVVPNDVSPALSLSLSLCGTPTHTGHMSLHVHGCTCSCD